MPELTRIALTALKESPSNPRKTYDQEKLNELAQSIRCKGVVQPILVRSATGQLRKAGTTHEIIAGSRRYRASMLAEVADIPCVVVEMSDDEVLEIQIIENSQREDVDPLEEAEGYQRLIDKGIHTVETLSQKLGHSPRYVFDRIRLNCLTAEAKTALAEGKIGIGGAQKLSRLNEEDQTEFFSQYKHNLSIDNRAISSFIERNVVLKVSTFPFKASDAKLVEGLPACTKCPKNTKNDQLLFPDEDGAKSGLCTDKACYQKKIDAFLEQLKASLREITDYEGEIAYLSMAYQAPEGTISSEAWQNASQEDGGAELGIVTYTNSWNGDQLYKPIWFKRRTSGSSSSAYSEKTKEQKTEEREKSRKDRVEMRTRKRVFDAIDKELKDWTPEAAKLVMDNLPRLLTVIAAKSALMNANSIGDTGDKDRHPGRQLAREVIGIAGCGMSGFSAKLSELSLASAFRAAFIASTYDEIHVDWRWSSCTTTYSDGYVLMAFADVFGIDVEMIRKEADFDLMSKKQQAEFLKQQGGQA